MTPPRSLALLLLVASAAAPLRSAEPPPFDYSGTEGRYVLLVNVDALNERVFHEELGLGNLPNISRMLEEKGGSVGRLVSAFPSSSAPAIPEFFHGRYMDRSATLPRKVHAFDRETRQALRYTFKDRNWDDDQVDVWDICAAGDLHCVSYYLRAYEGVSENHFRQKYLAWDSLFEYMKMSRVLNFDRRTLRDAARMFATTPEVPRLTYLWLDTLDVGGHIYGPYSEVYARGLREIDRGLGLVLDAMRRRRVPEGGTLYDRVSVVLFGDHGLTPSSRKIEVPRLLRAEGLKMRDTSRVSQFINEYLGRDWARGVDGIFVPGGSSVAELYLRRPMDPEQGRDGRRRRNGPAWTERLVEEELERYPTPRSPLGLDIVERLSELEGVDLVLLKEREGCVRIVSSDRGVARAILHPGGSLSAYVPIGDGDPLGYGAAEQTAPLVSRGEEPAWFPAKEWLWASVGTAYPFAVPRIPRAFGLHATESDLILVAKPGYDFLAHSRGDHGGLDPEGMLTPLLIAGPGAPDPGQPLLATTVDLLPTMLELMGVRPSPEFASCLDGVSLGDPLDPELLARLAGAGGL